MILRVLLPVFLAVSAYTVTNFPSGDDFSATETTTALSSQVETQAEAQTQNITSNQNPKLQASKEPLDTARAKANISELSLIDTEQKEESPQQEQFNPDSFQDQKINYTIQSGDTLSGILQNYNDNYAFVSGVMDALKNEKISLNSFLTAGKDLSLTIGTQREIMQISRKYSEGKEVSLKLQETATAENPSYDVEITQPEVITKQRTVAATISTSLAQTAYDNGLHYNLVDELVDMFGNKIEFTKDIHPDDTVVIIYEERSFADGTTLSPGRVIAASIACGKTVHSAVSHLDSEGKEHYIDQKGDVIGNYFLRYPLKFSRISSVFSKSRFHPVLKRNKPHNGTDFAAPTGTPVRSVANGTIEQATYHRGNGNWVKIKHDATYSTAYLHLSKIAKGIKKNGKVERGQLIGYVGSTGMSSGPHLHFSFYKNGKYVDPMKIDLPTMTSKKVKIDEKYFSELMALLKSSHERIKNPAKDI